MDGRRQRDRQRVDLVLNWLLRTNGPIDPTEADDSILIDLVR
jgi:hypothetical protein